MPSKLKKVAVWPQQDTGVGFYRLVQPARFLKRQDLSKDVRTMPFGGENQHQYLDYDDNFWLNWSKDADVLWSTILWDDESILRMLNLRKWTGSKWIVDIDDNFYAIPHDNPARAKVDQYRHVWETCLRACDGITVSVPALKQVYAHLNPNIFVQPNGIDFSLWDELKVKKNRSKKIRIGWRGALGHKDDLALIEPVITAIQKDYDVEFVCFGYKPNFPCEHHNWVTMFDYPAKLASLALDIAVVPLVDSAYNRNKSNLNYLENAALKLPIVYSPTLNQRNLAGVEAKNNYEWYNALATLIEDKNLRETYGTLAYEQAMRDYDMTKIIEPLANWFANSLRRTDLEP